jgi:hypothetical protein
MKYLKITVVILLLIQFYSCMIYRLKINVVYYFSNDILIIKGYIN